MTSVLIKQRLTVELERLKKLKGVMIKCGNKERSTTFLLNLYSRLKQDQRDDNVINKYHLKSFGLKNPLPIINRCLYLLMPAFVLRRIIKSGKTYNLPVPISSNHANFKAAHWLLNAAVNNNKNDLTLPSLLTQEIYATLNKQGAAYDSLKAYIDIAIDQRPFMRFVRKKRKVKTRSKKSYAGTRLRKIYRKQRTLKFKLRNRSKIFYKYLNTHNKRDRSLVSKKTKNVISKKK